MTYFNNLGQARVGWRIPSGGVTPSSLTTGLYAVYKAENNANDSLLNYNGTPMGGLTYTAGKSGNAFTFNGTNSHVLMPVNSMKKGIFSMNFWIFNPAVQQKTIFSDYGFELFYKGLYVDLEGGSSHTISFQGFNNSANVISLLGVGNSTFINRWSMTTITVNNTSLSAKIYLDGILKNSKTMANPINYINTDSSPCIGAYKPNNNNNPIDFLINGTKIDELTVWTKELTSTDVTALYNAGTGKFYPTF